MKKIIILVLCVLGASLIYLGKLHYDSKIAAAGKSSSEIPVEENIDLTKLTKNLSEDMNLIIQNKINNNETINILIVGSNALVASNIELSWPSLLEQKLIENYGEGIFKLQVENLKFVSTNVFIETDSIKKLLEEKQDIIIFEPLLLNDNGFVRIEDSLRNLSSIIDVILKEQHDTYLILQPANPILNAPIYEEQVNELKDYAQENSIEYFNHWEIWPVGEEVGDYLEGDFPNEQGHQLWADYFINYFISK
ncbi:SGNH/GDSL hydrolase family protein [Sutcliffiella rhizosphaerae]|uniref:SGNH/GDSL hydrolase family protein n=1 Tax=Sutcliffiella rhizosphaerae TaxID=2880967 RepID=A0ABM8YN45_9BACI|nr:SGNH/GDSL hydrolase family protein [Sutcliffiella rhizosphaerae]CAG9621400.1 hypothetical protein BACCIP111883_02173 [Sutcliffiella rhizosphaerae]